VDDKMRIKQDFYLKDEYNGPLLRSIIASSDL
jgi:hypothetical protein